MGDVAAGHSLCIHTLTHTPGCHLHKATREEPPQKNLNYATNQLEPWNGKLRHGSKPIMHRGAPGHFVCAPFLLPPRCWRARPEQALQLHRGERVRLCPAPHFLRLAPCAACYRNWLLHSAAWTLQSGARCLRRGGARVLRLGGAWGVWSLPRLRTNHPTPPEAHGDSPRADVAALAIVSLLTPALCAVELARELVANVRVFNLEL